VPQIQQRMVEQVVQVEVPQIQTQVVYRDVEVPVPQHRQVPREVQVPVQVMVPEIQYRPIPSFPASAAPGTDLPAQRRAWGLARTLLRLGGVA